MNATKKYPKGTFIVLGMLFGVPIGIALAIGTKNPGLIGIGPALGLPVGIAMEEKQRKLGKIAAPGEVSAKSNTLKWLLLLAIFLLSGLLAYLIIF